MEEFQKANKSQSQDQKPGDKLNLVPLNSLQISIEKYNEQFMKKSQSQLFLP